MTTAAGNRGRAATLVLFVVALTWLLGSAPAAAHGDGHVTEGEVTIPAGSSATWLAEVHYHRLLARIDADGPLEVILRHPDGATAVAHGPATSARLNELVACCEDAPWTPYELTVHNPGNTAVTLDGHLRLVHDDLAVMAYAAEPGVRESVVLLGGLWTWLLWRAVRRRRSVPRLRGGLLGLTVAVAAVGALAAAGWARYGTGGAPAVIGLLGDAPVIPTNPLVSRASLLVGATIVLWGWSGVRWAAARPSSARWPWLLTGLALLGTVAVTAVAVGQAYAPTGVIVGATVAAGLPVAVVLALGLLAPERVYSGSARSSGARR